MRRIVGRRSADKNVPDIPGCHRVKQPARILRGTARPFGQRQRSAKPSQAGIEHDQIRQSDTDPAETHRQTGGFVFGQYQRGARLRQPRAQAVDPDFAEHRDCRNIQRQLQCTPHCHRTLEGQIEIFRRVVAVTAWLVVDQRFWVDESVLESETIDEWL